MGGEKPQVDEVMDYRALAAYLKLAEGTLRHYVMKGTIPFVKIGSHVRFLKPEIEKWLLERNRRPAGKGAAKGEPVKTDGGPLPFGDKGKLVLPRSLRGFEQ
jgi:excisionase family DNA binding protein